MMTFLQKGFIFIAGLSILILSSCKNNDNDVIPDVFIDFTIDLLDPEFAGLTVIGVSDTIDSSTNNWGYKSAGYDNNGIIVYSGPDAYLAYDRTCPHDYSLNNISIKVKVDLSIAECPVCGTKYTLSGYGSPLSGIGKYPLKSYKTSFEENRYIRVWNQ